VFDAIFVVVKFLCITPSQNAVSENFQKNGGLSLISVRGNSKKNSDSTTSLFLLPIKLYVVLQSFEKIGSKTLGERWLGKECKL